MTGLIDALYKRILLAAHPVGSIYQSTVETSPAKLFGGVWKRISGRFLYAEDATHTAGSTGGTETHTLTAPELPVISGVIEAGAGSSGSGTANGHGALRSASGVFSTNRQCHYAYDSADKTFWTPTDTDAWQQVNMSFGGGKAHNNMPPYLAVYMWKRTA